MKYAWRNGYPHPKDLDPEIAAKALEVVRKRGELTPAAVVEAARVATSPLHRCFEWDDSIAAEAHRLSQARTLIASVVVRLESEQKDIEVRAYISVPGSDGKKYEDTQIALSRDDLRRQLLDRALHELEQWEKRYRDLVEFTEVLDALKTTRLKLAS